MFFCCRWLRRLLWKQGELWRHHPRRLVYETSCGTDFLCQARAQWEERRGPALSSHWLPCFFYCKWFVVRRASMVGPRRWLRPRQRYRYSHILNTTITYYVCPVGHGRSKTGVLKCSRVVYDRTVQYFGLFGYSRTRMGTAQENSHTPYYLIASVFGNFQSFTYRVPWVFGSHFLRRVNFQY